MQTLWYASDVLQGNAEVLKFYVRLAEGKNIEISRVNAKSLLVYSDRWKHHLHTLKKKGKVWIRGISDLPECIKYNVTAGLCVNPPGAQWMCIMCRITLILKQCKPCLWKTHLFDGMVAEIINIQKVLCIYSRMHYVIYYIIFNQLEIENRILQKHKRFLRCLWL